MTKSKVSKTAAALPSQRSKLDQLLVVLRRQEGATIEELVAATGWKKHSVRGAMSGALKRKGHAVSSAKADGVRRYKLVAEA